MTSLYQRTRDAVEGKRVIKENGPTNVTFRITLPPPNNPSTVHVLGSWDNYRTLHPLERDSRVGSGVWKGMISEKVGLQMGVEYEYYYLLDTKRCIPDPCSTPELTKVDAKGRLVSILYVPRQVQGLASARQSSTSLSNGTQPNAEVTSSKSKAVPTNADPGASLPSQLESYIDGLFGNERPQSQGKTSTAPSPKRRNSFKAIFRGKNSSKSGKSPDCEVDEAKRKWSLPRSFLRRKAGSSDGESDWLTAAADFEKEAPAEYERASLSREGEYSPTSDTGDLASYLRNRDLSVDTSTIRQPTKAHYYSPVTGRLHTPIPTSKHSTPLTRNVSDASQYSKVSGMTSPSLSYSAESYYSPPDPQLRSPNEPEPQSAFSPDSTTPNSSNGTEDDADEGFEVGTPVDGLGIQHSEDASKQHYEFPRYYNFDELHTTVPGGNRDIGVYAGDVILTEAKNGSTGAIKPLGCLREEIAGEMAWREEMVEELGYLGRVVV